MVSTRLPALFLVLSLLLAFACSSEEEKIAEHMAAADAFLEDEQHAAAMISYKNVIQLDPNHAAAHYGLARALAGMGDLRKAYWELRESVRLDPNNLDARIQYAQMARMAGEFEEVLTQSDYVIEHDETRMPAYLLKAEALAALSRYDEAQAEYEQAVERFPEEGAPLLLLANFLRRQGQNEVAEPYFHKLTEVQPGFGSYAALAGFLAQSRDRDAEAEAAYLKAAELAEDEEKVLTRRVLASFYYSRGRFAEAEQVLTLALEEAPENLDLIYTLARFYAAKGNVARADEMILEATRARPDDVRPFLVLSAFRGREGDLEGALEAAESALKIDPKHVKSRLRKAELLLDLGYRAEDKAQVIQGGVIVNTVLEKDPSNPDALFVRAKIKLADHNTEDAISDLRRAIGIKADWAEAHYLLGSALFLRRELNAARAELLRALEIDVHLVEAQRVLARIHGLLGEDEEAVATGRQVLESHPDDIGTKILVAQSLVRLHKRGQALAELESIPAANQNGESLYAQGRILLLDGETEKAHEMFLAANEAIPNHHEVLQSLLKLESRQGQLEESIARIEEAVRAEPDDGRLLRLQGVAYVMAGRGKDAEASFYAAIEKAPNDLASYQSLAQFLALTGRRSEVLSTYEKAAEARPDSAGLQLVLGSLYEAFGQNTKARATYERGIQLDPNLAPAKNNLAYLLAEANENLDRALDLAQEAKSQLPDSGHTADTLGWVLYRKGIPSAAIGYLKEAEGHFEPGDPNLGIVRHHLALAFEANGEPDKALAALDRALEDLEESQASFRERTGKEPPPEPDWVVEIRAMAERLRTQATAPRASEG